MKKGESAYSQALPGINGFLLSMVMVLLLQKRKVNAKMSCYQMFKVALDYIAHSDWASTGATLAGAQEGAPDISTFTSQYDVTLVDSSGHYNIAANVPLSAYAELKSEARDSVRVLDSHAQSEDFEALFMNPADYLTRCDGFVHVRALASLNAAFSLDNRTKTDVIADWGYGTPAAVVEKMCALVRRGLGDRVTQLRLRYVEVGGLCMYV
ncbi:hypothetical protein SARC_08890 [Sphaeroforma arctica JP610]|uniref:Nrap protein domain-containing protein n=1 Tax=Sphaeroforma arctica JP610 TaxID=667725 RepID=A0A0L0FPQ1_9EUKA|nr:hypothetical protein SARC_08890 [Sphaeroforma arctica JP610]KNC78689.1 hypothetical protein SARC_08890 [Sphaeroforma arctica JP610]|eukprot:XP_014152591.1 hypothetical protein SARC_08890 [Sphaeroforma arctica JP610]